MLKNTTFNLPEDLISRAKAYAASHGTSMTSIVREHLEAITTPELPSDEAYDPLISYSKGELSRNDAIRLLEFRDYAQLLIALGEADLPMPLPPAHEVENQAARFVEVWKKS